MDNFFEIDFLSVESAKSGDAITIRYQLDGESRIHVVDAGFQDTGDKVVDHVNRYYGSPALIDSVVLTHPDGDHAGGLLTVLDEFRVGELWMLRPWLYADELLSRFSRYSSTENLIRRLKEVYPNVAALEQLANEKRIPIREPFQGAGIGDFVVLAPTKGRYLDLIVQSDKTPDSVSEEKRGALTDALGLLSRVAAKAVSLVRAAWGAETFSTEETSAENDMSVVQFANLLGERILLTGDVGRGGLSEAADFAPSVGLILPGIDRFQVPHHGSRRNVNTELLDRWLGPRLQSPSQAGDQCFSAIVSASEKDKDHPRKAVIRAMYHRGGRPITTEDSDKQTGKNAPARAGWTTASPVPYPEEQEED